MKHIIFLIALFLIILSYLWWPQLSIWSFSNTPQNAAVKKIIALSLENESLKAKFLELELKSKNNSSNEDRRKYLVSKIYSTYPFNDKNILIIAAGVGDGLKEGMPVLAAKNILLGKVIKVFEHYSQAETIFSSGWQSTVKVGEENFDGLLVGGPLPKITMIVDHKNISIGQKIYNTFKDFPYGFKIGEVKTIRSANEAFKEVAIDLPYDLNQLLEVTVLMDY